MMKTKTKRRNNRKQVRARYVVALTLFCIVAAICKAIDLVLYLIDKIPQKYRNVFATVVGLMAFLLLWSTAESSDLNEISFDVVVRNGIISMIMMFTSLVVGKGSDLVE